MSYQKIKTIFLYTLISDIFISHLVLHLEMAMIMNEAKTKEINVRFQKDTGLLKTIHRTNK